MLTFNEWAQALISRKFHEAFSPQQLSQIKNHPAFQQIITQLQSQGYNPGKIEQMDEDALFQMISQGPGGQLASQLQAWPTNDFSQNKMIVQDAIMDAMNPGSQLWAVQPGTPQAQSQAQDVSAGRTPVAQPGQIPGRH